MTDCIFLSCHVRVSESIHIIAARMSRNSLLETGTMVECLFTKEVAVDLWSVADSKLPFNEAGTLECCQESIVSVCFRGVRLLFETELSTEPNLTLKVTSATKR